MKKKLQIFIRKLFVFNLIMAKNNLAALDLLEDIQKMNKDFEDKIKPNEKK